MIICVIHIRLIWYSCIIFLRLLIYKCMLFNSIWFIIWWCLIWWYMLNLGGGRIIFNGVWLVINISIIIGLNVVVTSIWRGNIRWSLDIIRIHLFATWFIAIYIVVAKCITILKICYRLRLFLNNLWWTHHLLFDYFWRRLIR